MFFLFIVAGGLIAPGCKEVFERTLDKDTVVLAAPGNNVSSMSASQTFFWEPVDSGVNYELQIVSPRFDSIVRLAADTFIQRNILTLTLDTAIYQWRVRAFNSSSTTPFSTPWTFTINQP
jgi:hypothetical protein